MSRIERKSNYTPSIKDFVVIDDEIWHVNVSMIMDYSDNLILNVVCEHNAATVDLKKTSVPVKVANMINELHNKLKSKILFDINSQTIVQFGVNH